jgi:hypothetical protein
MNHHNFHELLDEMMVDEFEASESILGKRLWTPKPDRAELFPQTLYTDKQLVECFIQTTESWYADKENALYGWDDEVRAELIRCLKDNDEVREGVDRTGRHVHRIQRKRINP